MSKTAVGFTLVLASNSLFSSGLDLYNSPANILQLVPKASSSTPSRSVASQANVLQALSSTQVGNNVLMRYQQFYYGVPIVGSQVIISSESNQGRSVAGSETVSGHFTNAINLNVKPKLTKAQALALARRNYFTRSQAGVQKENAVLQIREVDSRFVLTYLVSFRSIDARGNPTWPLYIVNAQTGVIIQQWDNIQHYADTGPGGNLKTQKYIYGKNGLPALQVIKKGPLCTMDSSTVRLTNLHSKWDYYDAILTPYTYVCGKNNGDPVHGAYGPSNDAFYFGQLIVAMYLNWYGLPPLRDGRGRISKLFMRVHFGSQYENAFWDGTAMNFGDGQELYPLVSLDIACHEVTHGFTAQHAGLEYHDQPGALNEAMSDMAGETSKAYLLATAPLMYKKIYLGQGTLDWNVGETIIPSSMGTALRYMNNPAADGSSADCYSSDLATKSGASCQRSYAQVVAYARDNIDGSDAQQDYIVHMGSGVYNKAFYLLSQKFGVRVAYRIMVRANTKYWTPTSNFTSAACGVLHATKDYKLNTNTVRTVFNQVGIYTTSCKI